MSEAFDTHVERLFRRAMALDSPKRRAFLESECQAVPPEVRARVLELLAQENPGGLLGQAWTGGVPPIESLSVGVDPPEAVPKLVGPYRIVERIGKGGMGEVYRAEQEAPVRRTVALKIIKRGMETDRIVARFEAERQALALMNHPAVATVFDAGATSQGQPYFAMEYIEGVPITAFCDQHRLTTVGRLELFIRVCEGVQHAHQNAIIHRDIKPSNVLVTIQGSEPIPKIIDFGIAKATDHRLAGQTANTDLGQLIGTPEYMSPEQAEISPEGVDTRTDVYSLGVLLYELLVGALPFDPGELRRASFDEIRRRIREDHPEKPSMRIITLRDASRASAECRRTDPSGLSRQLRGDLDWITMKALEKDRARRYASPLDLAADINRHLRHEPVLARAPRAVYRARKFARRHWVGVSVLTGAVLILISVAARERVQTQRITREAKTAEQSLAFLVGLFKSSDPLLLRNADASGHASNLTVRDVLQRGAQRIERELADQPEVQARLLHTIGDVYMNLGLLDEAEQLLDRAVAAMRATLGNRDGATLQAEGSLADLYTRQGRLDDAERLCSKTIRDMRVVLGEEHPQTIWNMNNLASIHVIQGRLGEAEQLLLGLLQTARRVLGPRDRGTLGPLHNLAVVYVNQGRYGEAEALLTEVIASEKASPGEEHSHRVLSAMADLGNVLVLQGRYVEADGLYRRVLGVQRRELGDEHPDTLLSLGNLANSLAHQQRYDEAEPLYVEALEARRTVLGEDHPDTLWSMATLADLYRNQRRFEEAESLVLETIEGQTRLFGEDHPDTLWSFQGLAALFFDMERYEEAEPLYRDVLEARRRVLGETHRDTVLAAYELGCLLAVQGRHAEALAWLREAIAAGYSDFDRMQQEENLMSLHDDPEFAALVEEPRRTESEADAGSSLSQRKP